MALPFANYIVCHFGATYMDGKTGNLPFYFRYYVCMHAYSMYVRMYVCMHVCRYVCMYVCSYVVCTYGMYVCM